MASPLRRLEHPSRLRSLFWVESSPLMWNRIARTVALSNRLTL
jgi:hypothetical protein